MFALDRRVRGAAPHREIVSAHDDGPPVDAGPPEDEVGRDQLLQIVVRVVRRSARDLTDLVKASLIDEERNPLTDRVASSLALPFHSLRAAQLFGELLAAPQLVHFRLPVHAPSPFCPLSWHSAGAARRW